MQSIDGSNSPMPFGYRFFAVGPAPPCDDRSVPFRQFAKRLPIQNPDRPAVHRQHPGVAHFSDPPREGFRGGAQNLGQLPLRDRQFQLVHSLPALSRQGMDQEGGEPLGNLLE